MRECLNQRISQIRTNKDKLTIANIISKVPKPVLDKLYECADSKKVAQRVLHQNIYKAFSTIFNLTSSDIISIIDERLYIRFAQTSQSNSGGERRYNGESTETLEALKKEYIDETKSKEIYTNLDFLLKENLNFSYIDNKIFSILFIPIFRLAVEAMILNNIKAEHYNKLEGFGGYILREHFSQMLLYCAKNLLELVEKQNKNAIEFIKYYSDDFKVDEHGNKSKRPAIIDANNQKWNYVAINSIVMQNRQENSKITSQKEKLNHLKVAIKAMKNEIELIEQKIDNKKSEISLLELETAELDVKILESNDKEIMRYLNSKQREIKWLIQTRENEIKLDAEQIAIIKEEITLQSKRFILEQKTLQILISNASAVFSKYELVSKAISTVLAKR